MNDENNAGDIVSKAAPGYDLVVTASSAGGMEPLLQVLSGFPADFPAAVIAVQHLHPEHKSVLTSIASRRTKLKVKQAEEGDQIKPGWVYIAPPDYHVVVKPGFCLELSHAGQKNYVRPSADVLFDSAAQQYQDRLVAIILSGSGKDGKDGIVKVKEMGGFTIAQNRETAAHFAMPQAAISTGMVDQILPLDEIAPFVQSLVTTGAVS
jgi:two-component system, chemotaxis family, protein-glutamate methylesterase/glutaminase